MPTWKIHPWGIISVMFLFHLHDVEKHLMPPQMMVASVMMIKGTGTVLCEPVKSLELLRISSSHWNELCGVIVGVLQALSSFTDMASLPGKPFLTGTAQGFGGLPHYHCPPYHSEGHKQEAEI